MAKPVGCEGLLHGQASSHKQTGCRGGLADTRTLGAPSPTCTLALIVGARSGLLAPRTGPALSWGGAEEGRGAQPSPFQDPQSGCSVAAPESCLGGREVTWATPCVCVCVCVCVRVQVGRYREHSLIHQLIHPVSGSEAPVSMFDSGIPRWGQS